MKQSSSAVLVLNCNGKEFLYDCLTSLLHQTLSADIWLIDNGSSDGSVAYVKNNFPSVRLFKLSKNEGFTGAYNLAHAFFLKHKFFYKYYFFLNNDTICDRKLIHEIDQTFANHQSVGITQPTVINSDNSIALAGGRFLFLTGTTLGHLSGAKYTRSRQINECFWATGCALAIRTCLFTQLGGFADYTIYYEDLDLSWKVQNLGFKVVCLSSTYVKHFGGGSRVPNARQLFLSEKNRVLSYWRNLPAVILLLVLPVLLISRILLSLRFLRDLTSFIAIYRGLLTGVFYQSPETTKPTIRAAFHVIISMNMVKNYVK